MSNQSLIEKLGFETTDKVVIFHIDDIGFSHSANVAAFECLDVGVASCGSIIVPAPWLLEAAEYCKRNAKYDVGVHLTLTCEYELYRWRALSSVDPKTGLLDKDRGLWHTMEEAVKNVKPRAAEAEMRAQVQTALDCGVDVTHIDAHMGSVLDPKFIPLYLKVSREFNIPAFLPRITRADLVLLGLEEQADFYLQMFSKLVENGVPLLDHVVLDTMNEQPDKTAYYCKRLAEIKPGLTHFLFHPAKMSAELNAIVPETASARNQDYEAFTNKKLKECAEKNDLTIIGYRELREVINK